MDIRILLINAITLLYKEAQMAHKNHSVDLCKMALSYVKFPSANSETYHVKETLLSLKGIVDWMMENYSEEGYSEKQILQRARVATADDTYLYQAIADGVSKEANNDNEVEKQILECRQVIRKYIQSEEVKNVVNEAFRSLNFENAEIDYVSVARDLSTRLEDFTHADPNEKHPSIVDSVNFDDEDEISELLNRSVDEMSNDGVIKLGFQGLNRMLGDHEGLRRGEFVLVGALQHNWKTGFGRSVFKHAALYNKPHMRDPSKKPLLMHISLENELPMNVTSLYKSLVENETGEVMNTDMISVPEANKYIREKMGANGYHIVMKRLDPNITSYHDLFDIMTKYETEGYEIHLVVCDYLAMLSKKGLDNAGPTGSEIRELFRRVRNYTAPRGITFVTPHQLSTEAKALERSGIDNLVKEIANRGYYDGCRTIDNEVDLEIGIHIVKVPGLGSYLTCQRGKHRKLNDTPEKHKYCVLPFFDAGEVRDDVEGPDLSLKEVGARPASEGGGSWFDMDSE